MHFTKGQIQWLHWLDQNGGSAWLDRYGRVIANGANSMQGSQTSWLFLIIKGLVAANDEQRFVITDKGREVMQKYPEGGGHA